MRTIKFRAWDTERKKFLSHSSDVHIEINNPRIYKYNPLTKGYYDSATIIIQQFTSLLDKNGKEIYEGDVFEVLGSDLSGKITYKTNGVVVFEKGMYLVEFTDDLGYIRNFYLTTFLTKPKEVIGNIYENPHLLTPTENN